MGKTICFTGRRPTNLYGYNRDEYNDLVSFLRKELEKYIGLGFNTFITGGAQGFDQVAFWVVHSLKKNYPNIKNILYLPCRNQDSRWRVDGVFGKKEYQLMLSLADDIKYINDREYISALDMMVRNHAMVNDSDEVLCLYPNDSWVTEKGGTAECMRYAQENDVTMTQLVYDNHKHYHMQMIQ